MDQTKMPLYEALLQHREFSVASFHVPGHKNGMLFHDKGMNDFRKLLSIDVTELSGLDDLHQPTGVIKEAQELAAHLYGSTACYFLVGGSTVGNLAMIMATCKQGDTVLVQRNSHKSILNALRLAKVEPLYINPDFDQQAQIATCVQESNVINAIHKYPNAKALILTNPNYYGYTLHLRKIIEEAHKHNIAVLVDEAHGAHFGHRSGLFGYSAVEQGADIVVQSAHKTLPAMTMSSFLHYNSVLVSKDQLQYYLQLFQSSSPSYPLMASLDLARHTLANLTETEIIDTLNKITSFKKALNEVAQLKVIESSHFSVDPLKITIQSCTKLSGFEIQELLEEEGIYVELADIHNLLFVMPLMIKEDITSIVRIIEKKLRTYEIYNTEKETYGNNDEITKLALSYEEMERLPKEKVPLAYCEGKIIAEEITPYPPGIPLLLAGEKITRTHIKKLLHYQRLGCKFQGNSHFEEGINVFTIT